MHTWVSLFSEIKKCGKYLVKKNINIGNNNKMTNFSKILSVIVIITGNMKHSPCARHCVTSFHHAVSFNHDHNRMKKVELSFSSSHRYRKGDLEL